jgi:hypothetical protein
MVVSFQSMLPPCGINRAVVSNVDPLEGAKWF